VKISSNPAIRGLPVILRVAGGFPWRSIGGSGQRIAPDWRTDCLFFLSFCFSPFLLKGNLIFFQRERERAVCRKRWKEKKDSPHHSSSSSIAGHDDDPSLSRASPFWTWKRGHHIVSLLLVSRPISISPCLVCWGE
jgi:hypothetical protein